MASAGVTVKAAENFLSVYAPDKLTELQAFVKGLKLGTTQ